MDDPPPAASRARLILYSRGTLVAVILFVAISSLVLVAVLGLDTMSAMRAYVAGESRWSKAEQEATYQLFEYAKLRDPAALARYLEALEVPLGDRRAREELDSRAPNDSIVRAGFIRGGNDPADVAGMATLFRRFRHFRYVDSAIAIWTRADSGIAVLAAHGDSLVDAVHAGDTMRVAALLAAIDRDDRSLRPLEYDFSDTLGAGARWTKRVLIITILGAAALLLVLGVWVSGFTIRRVEDSERALRASEARHRALFENAPYGIAHTTVDGLVKDANAALAELVGADGPDDLRGVHLATYVGIPPDRRGRIISDTLVQGGLQGIELDWTRQDGTPIRVRVTTKVLRDPAGPVTGIESIVEDVTQQRVLEDQLRQSQKMEAVGQLTGGIAHDLNNVLTAVLANADLVAESLPPDAETLEADMRDLRVAARHGAQMIRKLLAFSRRQQLALRTESLPAIIADVVPVLSRILPEDVRVETRVDRTTPAALVDAGAVEQMIINLATNARDAMPDGGTVTVTVSEQRFDATHAAEHGWGHAGRYACIAVRDTGKGMDEVTRRRVFEPFFTTKPVGVGSGLGLAMVYGLMKQHDGYVSVESSPGGGTSATLYFPATEELPQRDWKTPAQATHLTRGSGKILLVEDEAVVRRAAKRTLVVAGYDVVEAEDGSEALELLRAEHATLSLVLSDVVMPTVGGPALYRQARQLGYEVPFLMMSGYAQRDGPGRSLPAGVPFLAKPWTAAELTAKVREVIDAVKRA